MAQAKGIFFSPNGGSPPPAVHNWMAEKDAPIILLMSGEELMGMVLRGKPLYVIFDARQSAGPSIETCKRLKTDPFTAVVPAAILSGSNDSDFMAAFSSCADDILREDMSSEEVVARLDLMLQRSVRDTDVHPSTRLPGTTAIAAEIGKRMASGEKFGVCYADLDHFKEFNDRYSYTEGDRVIRILATLLHDVVQGMCGGQGFVGHIGGDDFIFIVPLDAVEQCCAEIVSTFDLIVRFQYSDQDCRAGYFFGKDRRGQLHRVPLMTLSIGVVTNNQRTFTSPGEVSRLATEMKTYAKTLSGSVFTVDRRSEGRLTPPNPMPAVNVPQHDKIVAGDLE